MISNQMPTNTLPNYNQPQSYQSYEQNPQGNNNIQTPLLQEAVSTSTPKMTGMDKLTSIEGINISQTVKEFDVHSWCSSSEHQYFLYKTKTAPQKGEELFKIVERSKSNCFDMEVNHEDSTPFMRFEYRSGCNFDCTYRPEMDVFLVEGGPRVKLGKVKYAFQCCKFNFQCRGLQIEAYDASDSLRFAVKRACCQSCCVHLGAELIVCDPFGDVVEKLKRNISADRAQKIVIGWFVNFPKDSSAGDRALLIAATMMVEHFEIDQEYSAPSHQSQDCDCPFL